jgi:hypothetical protein
MPYPSITGKELMITKNLTPLISNEIGQCESEGFVRKAIFKLR